MKTRHRTALFALAATSLALAAGTACAQPAPADPAHLSLSFVKFNVSNQPVMQAFYEKAFGMQQQKRIDLPGFTEVILTDPKGLDLALVFYKDKRVITLGNANGPIGFYLQDVDAVYKSALAAGGVSRSAPSTAGNARVAVVVDPEGHEIELLHLN